MTRMAVMVSNGLLTKIPLVWLLVDLVMVVRRHLQTAQMGQV